MYIDVFTSRCLHTGLASCWICLRSFAGRNAKSVNGVWLRQGVQDSSRVVTLNHLAGVCSIAAGGRIVAAEHTRVAWSIACSTTALWQASASFQAF